MIVSTFTKKLDKMVKQLTWQHDPSCFQNFQVEKIRAALHNFKRKIRKKFNKNSFSCDSDRT